VRATADAEINSFTRVDVANGILRFDYESCSLDNRYRPHDGKSTIVLHYNALYELMDVIVLRSELDVAWLGQSIGWVDIHRVTVT